MLYFLGQTTTEDYSPGAIITNEVIAYCRFPLIRSSEERPRYASGLLATYSSYKNEVRSAPYRPAIPTEASLTLACHPSPHTRSCRGLSDPFPENDVCLYPFPCEDRVVCFTEIIAHSCFSREFVGKKL